MKLFSKNEIKAALVSLLCTFLACIVLSMLFNYLKFEPTPYGWRQFWMTALVTLLMWGAVMAGISAGRLMNRD